MQLVRDGVPVGLGARAAATLAALLDGIVVSKQDLLDEV
jgi:DNA-binding winged helix-turn-helix (wHTH) protein